MTPNHAPLNSSRGAADSLFLFARCHEWVVALDAYWIDRIVLASETPPPEDSASQAARSDAPGFVGRLFVDGQIWPAWDLGLILEMDPLENAWVLMRSGNTGADKLSLALRVGACLSFGPLEKKQRAPLPFSMCRRSGVFESAFSARLASAKFNGSPVGLKLNPATLWAATGSIKLEAMAEPAGAAAGIR